MTIEQLEYVIAVADNHSINKASQKLFISQSALSVSLQRLEEELGQLIFIRSNKGVELTQFGELFVKSIRNVVENMATIKKEFLLSKEEPKVKLSVANDSFHLVSNVIVYILDNYKDLGIQVDYYDTFGDSARELVSQQVAEVGVVHIWDIHKRMELRQIKSLDLEYFPLVRASLAVTVGKGNPLFRRAPDSITPEMLSGYPMIKYSNQNYGPYESLIRDVGLDSATSSIVTNSRAAISDLLANSPAYILDSTWSRSGPLSSKMSKNHESLIIPLISEEEIRSEMGWVKRSKTQLSEPAKLFIDLLTDEVL